jgi:hypothetical protein
MISAETWAWIDADNARKAEASKGSPWRNPGPPREHIRDEEWPERIRNLIDRLNQHNGVTRNDHSQQHPTLPRCAIRADRLEASPRNTSAAETHKRVLRVLDWLRGGNCCGWIDYPAGVQMTAFISKLLSLLFPYETNAPKTELDLRRQYPPKHNPGFDLKARAETARLHGLNI